MRYPVWIYCCKWPNYDFHILLGSAATVKRLGGQNHSHLRQVSSQCCMLNIAKKRPKTLKKWLAFLRRGVLIDEWL